MKPPTELTDTELNITVVKARGYRKCNEETFASRELWHLAGRGFLLEKDIPSFTTDMNAAMELVEEMMKQWLIIRIETVNIHEQGYSFTTTIGGGRQLIHCAINTSLPRAICECYLTWKRQQ